MTDMRVNRTGAIRTETIKTRTTGKGAPENGTIKAGPFDIPPPPRFMLPILLGQAARTLAARWRRWRSARRTRAALERLDEAALRDIGLSRGYYGYEANDELGRQYRQRVRRLGADFGLWRLD